MDSLIDKNYDVKIVSPAGNLDKLKFAVKYGADEVYFGGKLFNLRNNSGNFNLNEIEEGIKFSKERGVKTTFLLNSFLYENDIENLKIYVEKIKNFDIDAIMISDPGVFMILKEADIKAEIHLSTQMSTLNHLAIEFWNKMGFKRIVLARETSIEDIRRIRKFTNIEIEIFVHGALCISYSGRCLLSRFLSGRDANKGNCSHPCRWRYALIEEKRPGNHLEIIEYAHNSAILSSKDLCLLKKLPEYIEAGVNAFKIEGRMKSLYHTANTTRIYKDAILAYKTGKDYDKLLTFWQEELDLVSHRPYTDDLFNEFDNMKFNDIPYIKNSLFLGYKISDEWDKTKIYVKTHNPIYLNERIEAIFPIHDSIKDETFLVEEIIDNEKNVDMARPGEIYLIKFDKPVNDDAIFRRKLHCDDIAPTKFNKECNTSNH